MLSELAEKLDPEALRRAAAESRTPDVQRLGYLLDLVGHPRLADPLLRALSGRRYRPVPLASGAPVGNSKPPEAPWRIIPNVRLELDQ